MKTIKKFRKLPFILGMTVVGVFASSCNEKPKAMSAHEEREYKVVYVEDTITTAEGLQWAKENWEMLDSEYNTLTTKEQQEADKIGDQVDENISNRWTVVKTKVSEPVYSTYVMSACSGLGSDKPNAPLTFITAENIEQAYAGFVNAVKMDYDKFSKEDATLISAMWDDLNDRKNQVEPIPAKDNLKIAAHKAEFAVVKSALKIKTGAEKPFEDNEKEKG
mgnify:CR=1 FL=1